MIDARWGFKIVAMDLAKTALKGLDKVNNKAAKVKTRLEAHYGFSRGQNLWNNRKMHKRV